MGYMYEYNPNGQWTWPNTQYKIERVVKAVHVDETFENGELVSRSTTVEYEDKQVPYTPVAINTTQFDVNIDPDDLLRFNTRATGGAVQE